MQACFICCRGILIWAAYPGSRHPIHLVRSSWAWKARVHGEAWWMEVSFLGLSSHPSTAALWHYESFHVTRLAPPSTTFITSPYLVPFFPQLSSSLPIYQCLVLFPITSFAYALQCAHCSSLPLSIQAWPPGYYSQSTSNYRTLSLQRIKTSHAC